MVSFLHFQEMRAMFSFFQSLWTSTDLCDFLSTMKSALATTSASSSGIWIPDHQTLLICAYSVSSSGLKYAFCLQWERLCFSQPPLRGSVIWLEWCEKPDCHWRLRWRTSGVPHPSPYPLPLAVHSCLSGRYTLLGISFLTPYTYRTPSDKSLHPLPKPLPSVP